MNSVSKLDRTFYNVAVLFLILGLAAHLLAQRININDFIYQLPFSFLGLLFLFLLIPYLNTKYYHDIYTDIRFVFSAFFAIYFLIGSTYIYLGSEEGIAIIMQEYSITAPDVFRVNSINCIGFGIALLSSCLAPKKTLNTFFKRIKLTISKREKNFFTGAIFLIILIFNFAIYHNDFQLKPSIIPGIVRNIAATIPIMIVLGFRAKGNVSIASITVSLLTAFSLSFFGLMSLNKSSFIIPLIAFAFGIFVRYRSILLFLGSLLIIGYIFLKIAPAVTYGRVHLDEIDKTSIEQRYSLFRNYFNSTENISITKEQQSHPKEKVELEKPYYSVFARFNYLNTQVAAINFYDIGNGGDSFRNIGWIFLPRLIFPNKPVLTLDMVGLYEKITGTGFRGSSSGIGIFIDGYYNKGWGGVVLVSILTGFILSFTSALSRKISKAKLYFLYPIIFMGLYMGFRIDGNFITDYLGVAIIIFSIALIPLIIFNIKNKYF